MVYKPLAARVALIAGFRRALPVFNYMIVVGLFFAETRFSISLGRVGGQ